ncbi:MAG: glutathione S-transferase family protein [Polyangiales bacterium]|jgi:glutathione S-transferase
MKTPRFKLYHYPATRSARVKWMLHEVVDDDFEVQLVPLYKGKQYEAEYLRKNPNHNVPTLEITMPDGRSVHMLESGAIVTWLADAFPDKGLAPPPTPLSLERADYLQMLYFGASWMDMILWQVRVHEHLLADDDKDTRTIKRYRDKFISEIEPQLRERFERQPFICGDAFTAADCIIGHNVSWARGYGLCRDEIFRSYISRVSKRPAFVKAFSDVAAFQIEAPDGSPLVDRFTG